MSYSKDCIIDMFYNEHLKVKDIAIKIKVSSTYITKIIKEKNNYKWK